jgi:hypothetical protein
MEFVDLGQRPEGVLHKIGETRGTGQRVILHFGRKKETTLCGNKFTLWIGAAGESASSDYRSIDWRIVRAMA